MSLAILYRPTAIVRSWPDASTSASRAPWASKWLRASVSGSPVVAPGAAITDAGERRRRVDAGADRGPAEWQLADPGQDGRAARCRSATWAAYPPNSWPSVTGVASMRCVRPALTTSSNSPAFAASAAARCVERRDQLDGRRRGGGEVDGGREHVVGRLRRVHVVVRVHRACRAAGRRASRSPRWRSCSTTSPTRSGTRRSGTGRRAPRRPPRPRRRRSPSAMSPASTPSSAFTARRRALDRRQGPDVRGLEARRRRSGSSPPPAASAPATALGRAPGPHPSCRAQRGIPYTLHCPARGGVNEKARSDHTRRVPRTA